eukprot:CAMPEP_0204487720 /NCGR_PEP_ID=MMETSP0471-20130131/67760_1 /ASSEMBLY_ACC=CAM_ASM_000602 /TAXON_ID=2969 /ORGANISM="Oxyrrhis marina" /LENGTH=91 /DNA_ID=CAMNT_0051491421 /DNA_START=275 /DNA_END=547 /DNA_ORIENTATION=+
MRTISVGIHHQLDSIGAPPPMVWIPHWSPNLACGEDMPSAPVSPQQLVRAPPEAHAAEQGPGDLAPPAQTLEHFRPHPAGPRSSRHAAPPL